MWFVFECCNCYDIISLHLTGCRWCCKVFLTRTETPHFRLGSWLCLSFSLCKNGCYFLKFGIDPHVKKKGVWVPLENSHYYNNQIPLPGYLYMNVGNFIKSQESSLCTTILMTKTTLIVQSVLQITVLILP